MMKNEKKHEIKVKHSEENPEPQEVLAEAIIKIGDAVERLRKSGLNENAIIVLLHDALKGKVGKPAIRLVFESLPRLKDWYCR